MIKSLFSKKTKTPLISDVHAKLFLPNFVWIAIVSVAALGALLTAIFSLFLFFKILNDDNLHPGSDQSDLSRSFSIDERKLRNVIAEIKNRGSQD